MEKAGEGVFHNVEELAEFMECEPLEESMSRELYQGTECGAWLSLNPGSIRIGSIVEGVSAETPEIVLAFPFTEDAFIAAIAEIEKDAKLIWDATHGCEECGDPDPEWEDLIAINPECKKCGGQGIII